MTVTCTEPLINLFLTDPIFFFTAMLLLHFLEACIGAFDLWPAYVLELLFCNESTPQNIRNVAASFMDITSHWGGQSGLYYL